MYSLVGYLAFAEVWGTKRAAMGLCMVWPHSQGPIHIACWVGHYFEEAILYRQLVLLWSTCEL